MALSQHLEMKQGQSLVMTPQLQQSIKILQMNSLDLVGFIEQELEQNPFLVDADGSEFEPESIQDAELSDQQQQASELGEAFDAEINQVTDNVSGEADGSWEDEAVSGAVYEDESYSMNMRSSDVKNYSGDDSDFSVEQGEAPEMGMKEYILDQITIDFSDQSERFIAEYLTDLLDESGYLTTDLADIATSLQCEVVHVEDVLTKLQALEPAGIFARDLAECLSLQLKDRNRYDPAMQCLVENLPLLAKHEYAKLRKLCDVSDEDFKEMLEEVKALNPKPGNNFGNDVVQVVQPDIFLKKDKAGSWRIELNSDALPRVLVNRRYYATLEASIDSKDSKSKKFLSEQLNTANWLVKSLDQRAQTIVKVATAIVEAQEAFFNKGIRHLKPLVLSDIAEQIEMHESTVSRVINGKYMATAVGLFELKYFFSSALSARSSGEGDVSSKTVKHLIKELIDAEKPDKILSDDNIALLLKTKDVNVARRTVAKYREAMGIPSSAQRKRQKRL